MGRKKKESEEYEREYGLMENQPDMPVKIKGSAESFLSQEQVQEYNEALLNAVKVKHSLRLGEPREVENSCYEYFDICKRTNQLPSIKALALYLGVTLDTMKKYMCDPTSAYFNTLNLARDMCHVVIEGGAMNNKVNPATYMFTAANYYGMKNTQSVEINRGTTETEKALAQSEDSLNALKSLIKQNGGMEKFEKEAKEVEFYVK